MLKIKSFVPTSDWYFVKAKPGTSPMRLAGFAVIDRDDSQESDIIIGMLPVHNGGGVSGEEYSALATVPPEAGTYQHASQLEN